MEFKDFMELPGRLDDQIYRKEEIITMLRARAEKCTAVLSAVPGGNAYDDSRTEELVARIDETDEEIRKLEKEKKAAGDAVCLLLAELESPMQIRILKKRYVDLKEFKEITVDVDRSERFVYQQHRKAMKEAEIVYERLNNRRIY